LTIDNLSDSAIEIFIQEENRLLLIGDLEGVQVADRDEAEETLVAIYDREVADAAIFHSTSCFLQRSIGGATSDFDSHNVADGGMGRIAALSNDALKNVAFTEHACDVFAIEDKQGTDFALGHEAGGFQNGRFTADGPDLPPFFRQNVADCRHGCSSSSKP
jgi:hypothetical protein